MNSRSEPSIEISEGVCNDTTLCDLELDKTFTSQILSGERVIKERPLINDGEKPV